MNLDKSNRYCSNKLFSINPNGKLSTWKEQLSVIIHISGMWIIYSWLLRCGRWNKRFSELNTKEEKTQFWIEFPYMFDLKWPQFEIMKKMLMLTTATWVHCIQVVSPKLCWLITLESNRVLCSYNPSLSCHPVYPSSTRAAGSTKLTLQLIIVPQKLIRLYTSISDP